MKRKNLLLSAVCVGTLVSPSFHYKPDALQYPIPEPFLPDFSDYQVNPKKTNQLPLGAEGTVLHIPKDAFVDMQGNVVEEPVTILYKEYNNAADMAFSRIPMTYKGDNFNSSGMFEIQGRCNGKPVRVAPGKSLQIDYRLAQKNPDTDFYRLNEHNGKWELVADIPQMASKTTTPNATATNKTVKDLTADTIPVVVNNINLDINNNAWNDNNWNVPRNALRANRNNNFVMNDDGNRANGTLLAENADAGHTYPSIVKGLNVESFGVYNCDQIYRVPNRVDVTATFKDENGKTINNLHVLSLIDLEYNGAFSFSPNRFTCNAKGNNVILLFSTSNELYLLDKGEFSKMNIDKSGDYTFHVKNVTKNIKNTSDLANHLGIKV